MKCPVSECGTSSYYCLFVCFFLMVFLLTPALHQGTKVLVENSDNYTVTAINRKDTGEYKCSLVDNEKVEASQNIVVSCEYL